MKDQFSIERFIVLGAVLYLGWRFYQARQASTSGLMYVNGQPQPGCVNCLNQVI